MHKRKLGRSGLWVSEIAFGGVEIGVPYGIGVTSAADMPTEAESIELVQCAIDNGINFFDTARQYGRSEEIIGKAVRQQREKVILCTKSAHLAGENGRLPGNAEVKQLIMTSLEASLHALQTDTIDLFMLHDADPKVFMHAGITDVFQECKEKGLIRSCGVSTYQVSETQSAIEHGSWDVIQLPFNLMDQRHGALLDTAEKAGVGIVVRSVLLKGVLSDRGQNLHPSLRDIQIHRERYLELLDEKTPTLSMLATRFALAFPQVAAVLVGIDRLAYLQQALAAATGSALANEKVKKAQSLAFPNPEFIDLPHWARMGWLT